MQPIFKLRSRLKLVQPTPAKQAKVAQIERIPNLFEYLPFPYGRRPKGSEMQPNFKLRSRLKLEQLTHERARVKLA